MERVPIANLKGPQGEEGAQGPRGFPGFEAVPTDEGIATLIGDDGSETRGELDVVIDRRTGLVVKSVGTPAQNVTALQAAVDAAVAFGVPVNLFGPMDLNGPITLPAGSILNGELGRLTMTQSLTNLIRVNNADHVQINNLRAFGKQTDYTNANGVYAACAVLVTGTSADVQINGGSLVRFAGAGVRIEGTASVEVRGVYIEGPGATYITGNTFNFSAGVLALTTAKWSVLDCDISEYAQGIVTGDGLSDVTINRNHIHHIRGQHGAYIESVDRLDFSGNRIHDCLLTGMKVQIGVVTAPDPQEISIQGNIIEGVGAQGILLTNPPGGSPRLRRVIVANNIVNNATGGGIEANNSILLHISDNIVFGSKFGMLLASCSAVMVADVQVRSVNESGIIIRNSTDVTVRGFRIADPGLTAVPASQFGVLIDGTSADVTLDAGKITADVSTTMRYGVYVSAGDQASMDFIDISVRGATDYGWRGLAATAARTFRGNTFLGTTGSMTVPPSNFGQIANATNATDVITQLNALLAVARSQGLIRT